MGDFACLIASMDWRSIKRHQSAPYSLNILKMDWSIDFPAFLSEEVIGNKKVSTFLNIKQRECDVQTVLFLMLDIFCLFRVCKHASSGWHHRSPLGNIRLINWSLFSPSSIAVVWWPGHRGTSWQRKRWRRSLAWRQPHWQALIYRPDLWLILCT